MGYETEEKKVSTDSGQETAEEQKIAQETVNKEDTKEQDEKTANKEAAAKDDLKKSRKGLIISIAVAVLICSILLFTYLGGAYYYKAHFFPHTSINGVDCGNQEAVQAIEAVQKWYSDGYTLKIVNENGEEQLVIKPGDCEMKFSVEQGIEQLLENQNEYEWLAVILGGASVEHQIDVETVYNEEVLQRRLQGEVLFTGKGEEPQNAYISDYQESDGGYIIVAEREGTLLDKDQTILCIEEALNTMQGELNLREAQCYVRPEVVSDDAKLQERLEQLNRIVGARITYDWNGNEEILDGEIIHTWIIEEDGVISLDEELIAAYVEEKAKAYDTYGLKRNFTTTLGIELTLPSGAYGWRTDREAETEALKELILAGAIIQKEPEYKSEGWVKGADDIGNSYVEIDLTNQHLYLYQDGEIVLESDFVSGNVSNGNTTPAGVFGLTYKTTDAVLRGENYETPVKYWMPFNGNIGMHDATWRRAFGGDIYLTNGSHGCINLPLNKAKEIYSYVSKGFPVICYYY